MKALMDANPKVDFMFIGDQLHAPYGALSKAELFKYGAKMIHEFQKRGIEEVVIACNCLLYTSHFLNNGNSWLPV